MNSPKTLAKRSFGNDTVPSSIKKVVVILIKPSSYHKDGSMLCGIRQGVPCNSLNVLDSLTSVALQNILPEHVTLQLHVFEEGILAHSRKLEKLKKQFPQKDTKLIVGLVGVQTMQFPRACDLASVWQQRGATVVIGGFHVSGSISTMQDGVVDSVGLSKRNLPCPNVMPPEIQDIIDKGIIVFHGEAEETWQTALVDILQGKPQKIYRGGKPDLTGAPLPTYYLMEKNTGYIGSPTTIDTSRGCPFTCSFCSIINVQGREMRFRNPVAIVEAIEELCLYRGRADFFFTDDNFARNPHWEEILDGLIALRARDLKINFMIEADLACGAISNFLDKLAAAGCYQIFMGVESMNPKNLKEAHKWQNNVRKYETLWRRCHDLGISIHAGYIIGFPYDTPESVQKDIRALKDFGADIASFFILTPIPGSEDHVRATMNGVIMDPDFNQYSSFEPVINHPLMSRREWQKTYDDAWRQFYAIEHMRTRLAGCKNQEQHRALQRVYMWYCWSIFVEDVHPMNSPFVRVRLYNQHRPGIAKVPYWRFLLQETWRYPAYFGKIVREFYRFQQINLPIRNHLNDFWGKYFDKKWRLLWPWQWNWHFRAIPRLVGEAICWASSLGHVAQALKS